MKLAFAILVCAAVSAASAAQQPTQQIPQQSASGSTAGMEPSYTSPNGAKVFRLDPNGPFTQFGPSGPAFVIQWPACPVSMQARQGMDGGMLKVRDSATGTPRPDMKPGQRIHLILGQVPNGKKIVSGAVKVSGLSARTRLASSDRRGPAPDMWRTVAAAFSPESDGNVAANLKLPGFTSVTSIQLISVTYDDGSEWTVPPTNHCSARPDPLMRVAER